MYYTFLKDEKQFFSISLFIENDMLRFCNEELYYVQLNEIILNTFLQTVF